MAGWTLAIVAIALSIAAIAFVRSVAVGSTVAVVETLGAVLLVGVAFGGRDPSDVDRVTETVRRIAAGEYDVEATLDRDDDLGRLSAAVDDLAASVADRERALSDECDRLRTERDRYAALFEHAAGPVAAVAVDGDDLVIRATNDRFERTFGMDGDADAPTLAAIVGDANRDAWAALRATIQRDEPTERVLPCETTAGVREYGLRVLPTEASEAMVVFADAIDEAFTGGIDGVFTDGSADGVSRRGKRTDSMHGERADSTRDDRSESTAEPRAESLSERSRAERDRAPGDTGDATDERVRADDADDSARVSDTDGRNPSRERTLSARTADLEAYVEYVADLLDAIDDIVYVLDREGTYRRWNRALADVTGYSEAEVARRHPREYFEGEDRAAIEAAIEEAFETGRTRVEADVVTNDGESIPYEFVASRLVAPDGTPVVAGVGRDVSERKQRERQFEALVEHSTNPISVKDLTGTYELVNDAAATPHGLTPDEVAGMHTGDLYDDAVAEDILETERRVIETGESRTEEVTLTVDGEERVFLSNKYPYRDETGEIVGIMGISQDVTERTKRQDELRERERALERYRKFTDEILDAADDMFYVIGEDMRIRRWNRTLADTTGYDAATIPELHALEFFADEHAERVATAVEDVFDAGHARVEADLVTKAGERIPYEFVASRLEDPDGNTVLVGIGRDVTERKEHERELRATRDRLQKLIEASPVGVLATDPEGTVTLWNDAMEAIFGWSAEEIVGEPYPAIPADADDPIRQRVLEGESVSQVELERVTNAGDRVTISLSTAPIYDDSGAVSEIVGFVRDVTERKERQAELERTKDLLQQTQRLASIGGWELDLTTGPPYDGVFTDEVYRIHELPIGASVDLERGLEFYHPEDRERVREAVERAIEHGEGYSIEARFETAKGNDRWVHTTGEPVYEDGELVTLRGAFQDVTDRKERERSLEALHEVARKLLQADTERAVADVVVETADDLLDDAGVAVYLLDPTTSRLEPLAYTDVFTDLRGDVTGVGVGDDSPLWAAFTDRSVTAFEGSADGPIDVDDAGGLVVPIGTHGVLAVASPTPTIEDRPRQVVETLVATTEAALDRLDSEESLREREAELAARNERLERQMGINELIRSIDQSLLRASSREEIEAAVCERLADSDDVAFAWIGAIDATEDAIDPRTWAGTNQEYLDAISLSTNADAPDPSVTTALTGEPTVVNRVAERLRSDAWRTHALVSEFSSAISVPLAFDEYSYGVLTVYSSEPEFFGDLERSVFKELGETIASSINAVETRQALHADTFVELTLRFQAAEDFLARVARSADCRVEYVGLGTHGEDRSRLFFETDGAEPAAVRAVLEDLVAVDRYRQISESEGRSLFEATVSGSHLAARLVRHGASPRSMTADGDRLEVVVDVSTATDVREFVGMVQEQYPTAELTARRDVHRDVHTREELVTSLFGELTERQLEVLRTAYFAGFFDWPRESTGEEIADMLEVSQPTVNRHLRLGQRRLLEQLLDEEAPPALVAE